MSSHLLALGCALLPFLASGALADQIAVGARTTSGVIEGTGAASNSDSDADSGSGFDSVESLAKVEKGLPNPYTWFASALVDGLSNLEVGVDLMRPACCVTGSSDAVATLEFTFTNPFDHPAPALGGIVLPPGEVLFRLPTTVDPAAGQDSGFFEAAIFAAGSATPFFLYRLELVTTNGGFEEASSSTNNVGVDEILNGSGGLWGYKTLGADLDIDFGTFGPHETRAFRYVMTAHGENHFQQGEVGAGFSVKLGDPFDVTAGGGIEIVPEPTLLVLLAAALSTVLLLGASPARAQACGVVEDVPSTFLADYLDTLGKLFPLSTSDCEKLTKSAVSACHKAVSQSAKCADSQIDGVRKGAKTACQSQGAVGACTTDIEAFLEALQGLLDDEVDAADAACDTSFEAQLDLACRKSGGP